MIRNEPVAKNGNRLVLCLTVVVSNHTVSDYNFFKLAIVRVGFSA